MMSKKHFIYLLLNKTSNYCYVSPAYVNEMAWYSEIAPKIELNILKN